MKLTKVNGRIVGNSATQHMLQREVRTKQVLCCCNVTSCWESPDDFVHDENGAANEEAYGHMNGSRGGYGSGEETKDWREEHGENSEHNVRVGDTCYWRDKKGPNNASDAADCSHSFHPSSSTRAPQPNTTAAPRPSSSTVQTSSSNEPPSSTSGPPLSPTAQKRQPSTKSGVNKPALDVTLVLVVAFTNLLTL
eukprot:CAMPEP_0172747432 /NCGR_PEP_ID=MMETSP1074-20121228/142793_1 /TAXON_ID=2916 /ORGANISM="Ceratium fusus, Strain PA161109" /LENGTH=193 /DNA_ID=CAMNT_0013578955 /DNA_START=33 /DNA_END=614 /DNA_ORIENTATION=-